jgi:hypothetical protein
MGASCSRPNPDQINVALLMKSPSFREFYKSETSPASDSAEVAFEEKAPKPNAITPRSRSRLLTKPYSQSRARTSWTASLKIRRRSSSSSSSICLSRWATAGPKRTQRSSLAGQATGVSTV